MHNRAEDGDFNIEKRYFGVNLKPTGRNACPTISFDFQPCISYNR